MKKAYVWMLCSLVFLLSACGKKEVVVQPIPDVTQPYNYIDTSVPIIDAIIDTETEVQYIQKIQLEYEQLAGYYQGHITKSSGLTPQSKPQTIADVKEGIDVLVKDLDYFRNRMHIIDLPSDYRIALVASLGAFIQSLSSESMRLSESANSQTKPSNALYQKTQDAHKKVQQTYRSLIFS